MVWRWPALCRVDTSERALFCCGKLRYCRCPPRVGACLRLAPNQLTEALCHPLLAFPGYLDSGRRTIVAPRIVPSSFVLPFILYQGTVLYVPVLRGFVSFPGMRNLWLEMRGKATRNARNKIATAPCPPFCAICWKFVRCLIAWKVLKGGFKHRTPSGGVAPHAAASGDSAQEGSLKQTYKHEHAGIASLAGVLYTHYTVCSRGGISSKSNRDAPN